MKITAWNFTILSVGIFLVLLIFLVMVGELAKQTAVKNERTEIITCLIEQRAYILENVKTSPLREEHIRAQQKVMGIDEALKILKENGYFKGVPEELQKRALSNMSSDHD
jgi:hypothetical protein